MLSSLTSRHSTCKSVEKSGYLQTKKKCIASHTIYQNKPKCLNGKILSETKTWKYWDEYLLELWVGKGFLNR